MKKKPHKKRRPSSGTPLSEPSPLTAVEEALHKVFREGLAGLLAPLGYQVNDWTLRRRTQEAVFLIHLHHGRENSEDSGSFTLELGVHFPLVTATLLELPAYSYLRSSVDPPQLAVCAHRARLGELWKGRDTWWSIGPDSKLKALTEEVAVVVLDLALPWLKQRQDGEDLLRQEDIWGLAAWRCRSRASLADEDFSARLTRFLAQEKDGARQSQLRAWGRA